MKGGS